MIRQGSIIQMDGVGYGVIDGEFQAKDGGSSPLKILAINDANSGLQVHIIFTPDQFEEFLRNIEGKRIIAAAGPLRILDARGK